MLKRLHLIALLVVFNGKTQWLYCLFSVAKLTEELKIAIIQTIRTLVKNAEHRYS